jgi:hypothetical protein
MQYRRNIHLSDLYAWFIAERGGMINVLMGDYGVIASAAKQSLSIQVSEIMGLLRHFVPRNDRRWDFLRNDQL